MNRMKFNAKKRARLAAGGAPAERMLMAAAAVDRSLPVDFWTSDFWTFDADANRWMRHHVVPRRSLYLPVDNDGICDDRMTTGQFLDTDEAFTHKAG